MGKPRLSYDYVRDYINGEEGNGCTLLSAEYVDSKTPLLIQCACGETFKKSFADFKKGGKQCPKCGRSLNYSEVKNYIEREEGNGCKLLSEEYVDNKTKLKIQCACGEVFEKSFKDFKKGQKQCPKCGYKNSAEKQKGENNHFYGKCHTEETKQKQSEVKKGKYVGENNPNYGNGDKIKGENNPNYNPNLTDEEREKGRNIEGYDDFIIDVLKKDNYTCQCCGQYGGSLRVHHLNGYNWDKEHRTDVNNGIALCEDCHKEYHKIYGYGDNTIAQFREFLFNKYIQSHDLKFLSLIETIDLTTRAF